MRDLQAENGSLAGDRRQAALPAHHQFARPVGDLDAVGVSNGVSVNCHSNAA